MQKLLFENIAEPGLTTLDVYRRRGGYEMAEKALAMSRDELVTELENSGLRGRGGAGFSMGKKASFLPKTTMDKYLVCNADESEPGTFKDRELMTKSPHMLIEGMIIAAHAAGANRSFIYIRGEYQEVADMLDALEGKRGNPRLKPPFPANQGLYQGPTLINNVETLMTIPHILRLGAEDYAKIGVANSTGTKVVSVSGNVQRP